MDDEVRKIYEAFGYDCSKPLRKLNQVTDEEAITIAKIFDNTLDWKINLDNRMVEERIELESNKRERMVLKSFGRGTYNKECSENIYLNKNGTITGTIYPDVTSIQFIHQYLFSIGVERPILTKGKLENILNNSKK